MRNRYTAASLLLSVLHVGCRERESSCDPTRSSETTEAKDAGNEGVTNVTEPFQWVELNGRNVLDGTWTTRRFSMTGEVSMEDSSGVMTFTLTPPEVEALVTTVNEPSFVRFMTNPAPPCPGVVHNAILLKAQTAGGTTFEQGNFTNCLWTRRENVNLGQITYGVQDFLGLATQISVSHLDCPHPQELQDGIIEPLPPELNSLCQLVWNELSSLESAECQDGAIGVGVEDCY
jgi:hypothetical protein